MERIWIAGPCAAESRDQLLDTAAQLAEQAQKKNITLNYFRAGAWKVRSAPDSFAGLAKGFLGRELDGTVEQVEIGQF